MKKFLAFLAVVIFVFVSSSVAKAQANVVLRAGGDITTPGDWGAAPDGTASVLTDFSANNTYSFTANNASRTLSTAWNITAGSTVILGDGASGFTLTYSGSATMGSSPANVTMNNLSHLLLNSNYNLDASKTTLNSGSSIEYGAGTTTVASEQYDNLTIAENVSTNSSTIVVQNTLTIVSGKILTFNNSSELFLNGTTNYNGTISGDGTGSITVNGLCNLSFTNGSETIGSLFINNSGSLLSNVNVSSTFSLGLGIFTLNGFNLTLNGNIFFKSNATAVIRGNSTSSITIGGSGTITNNLIMDNTNSSTQTLGDLFMSRSSETLTLANTLRIRGSITPSSGTIDVGSNLILEANSSSKARVGIITASGALTGSPTVNVFKPAGFTGWVNLCSAGVTGNTMANWNSSFPITCPSCPDGSTANNVTFTSIYSYSESATSGSAAAAAHYVELATITEGIDSKAGYWVYLGDGYPTTSAITIPLTGSVNTKNSSGSFNLTLTGGVDVENGWNLIANPYPSPIQVSQFITSAGGSNIDNTLLVYDPDTDSNVPLTGGSVIPMGQAFMVRALVNNTSVAPDETWKTASADNTAIQKQIQTNLPTSASGKSYYFDDFMLDLQSTAVAKNFFTQAYFTFGSVNTSAFDNGKDVYSMASSIDPGTPRIMSISNSQHFLRNALPQLNGVVTIPIFVSTGYAGVYSIHPVNLAKLPAGACVQLIDLLTNTVHDLKNGAYTTTIAANQTTPQYELKITLNPSSLTQQISDPLCKNGQDGYIVAKGSGAGPWTYTWKDAGLHVIKVKTAPTADTLMNLQEGIYNIDVNTVGTCDNATSNFILNAITALPHAQFTLNSTNVDAHDQVPVSFTNLSSNASDFTWDFGNGITVSSLHATMLYPIAGSYTVTLEASNGVCGDVSRSSVLLTVNPGVVGLSSHSFAENAVFAAKDEQGIFVSLSFDAFSDVEISACNVLGQVLLKTTKVSADKTKFYISVPEDEKIVFVTVKSQDKVKTVKVPN